MDLYEQFGTDNNAETDGVKLWFGDSYFTVARAGGANQLFTQAYQSRVVPLQQRGAEQTEMDNTTSDVFVDSCVRGWGSKKYGEGKLTLKGEVIDFTKAAAKQVLRDLPDLAANLIRRAGDFNNFRHNAVKSDAGNLDAS